jgi:chitodextrinase
MASSNSPMKQRIPGLVLFLLSGSLAFGQASSLSLASGTAVQGGSISLNLSLSASTASALQWTLSYAAANVTSVSVAAGPVLTAAGKTIQCRTTTGSTLCLASGMNSTVIANGVVAVVTVTLAPATSSASVPISVGGTIGSLGKGTAVAVSGAGGSITVQGWQPPSALTLTNLTCTPTSLTPPGNVACTVTLSQAAPATGTVVTLSDNSLFLSVPASITVSNTATATFNAAATSVISNLTAVVTATLAGVSKTSTLTLLAALDIQAPSVPSGLSATPASSSQINLSWTASTDNAGVTGYKIFRNGAQIGTATTTSYSDTGLTSSTAYSYTVSAYDAAGNNSAQSTAVSATTRAASSCVTSSSTSWPNTPFATQTTPFTVTYDDTPSAANMNGATGLSLNAATGYTSLAVTTRFNPAGFIDAVNGDGTFSAVNSIPYAGGKVYHFRVVANPQNHTYSAYVTPPSSAEIQVANNYPFRTTQLATSSLNSWTLHSETGTHTVCSFTLVPPAPPTVSLWSSSTVPSIPWKNDAAVTVGVKFRSDVSGSVTGIRFYKGTGNTGTHTGLLYSRTGKLLAQAAFTGETAAGWQQVNFPSPVSIAANTTYIAAFFTASGYADNLNYFTSSGTDSPPLHALRSGVDGLNGVYRYDVTPQFPSFSYADSNYWVDLLFTAN